MLETDDVDDDFFTPVSSTSLANIFSKSPKDEEADNSSLQYTPPKPHNLYAKPQPQETKTTQCIFSCTPLVYEWFNNEYIARGRLGFAILKILKTGVHNIILYDSSKTTLSSLSITRALEVSVKEDVYISYYDNLQKYWSLYGTESDIKRIVEILKLFDVTLKHTHYREEGPPKPVEDSKGIHASSIKDKDSDTDSSLNRKTKASILSRMATMGLAVLPLKSSNITTSDSTDSEEDKQKSTKNKTIKSLVKRTSQEPKHFAVQSIETQPQLIKNKCEQSAADMPTISYVSSQIVPVTNPILCGSDNMNIFMSEQRMSNSELRINMNRINDKLDQILDRNIKNDCTDKSYGSSNFQIEIFQKLLTEYENKIACYEDLLKTTKEKDKIIIPSTSSLETSKEVGNSILDKQKIMELEEIIKQKENQIALTQEELQVARGCIEELTKSKDNLEIKLYEILKSNDHKSENPSTSHSNISKDKLKSIMNYTFQVIATNFEDDEDYLGTNIKTIIAAIIKKITLESISES